MSFEDVTKQEEELIRQDICPDCNSEGFLEGPHGGMSINIMCANKDCKARFNWTGPFKPERLAYGLKKIKDAENV